MIRSLIFLSLLTTLISHPSHAQDVESAFEAKTFEEGSFTLPYRLYTPPGLKEGDQVPLLIFFHGARERGDNNISQMKHAVPSILAYVLAHEIPIIILVPQCPKNMQWVDVPWGEPSHKMPQKPSKAMHAAMDLLKQTVRDMHADPSRIYVTGISMGGFGAWDFAQRKPDIFAALLPVCGGGDTYEAKHLTDLPIWAFHGDQDKTVLTQRSRDMISAIKDAGGTKTNYTEYPGVGHDSWTQTYQNEEVLKWLFEQKKP